MVRGQSQKGEDTSSSRSRGTGKKMKNINDSSISGSMTNASPRNKLLSSKAKNIKGTTATSSTGRDSSTLRRSTRETPTKKSSPSSSSSRKSERLEKQNMSTPTKKSSSEREVKKELHSPLRRSERIEKFCASSSSGSKLSGKSSGSPEKKKKESEMKNEKKTSVLGTIGEHKSKKLNSISMPNLTKRKRMDARSYRALFTPVAKKAKISDSRPADSAAVLEGGDECSGRRCDKPREKLCDGELKEATECSSTDSRELAELAHEVDMDARSASFNMKQKHIESSESKYADNLAHLKCSSSSLQPSVVKTTAKKNAALKRTCDLDSDTSVTPQEEHILIQASSMEDACLSPPSLTKREKLEQCTKCFELQRVQDMQAKELCSCIAKRTHDLSLSFSEEAHGKVASDKHGNAASCLEEDKTKGNSVAGVEKPNCSVASACIISVDMPMEVTRERPADCNFMDIAKEHVSSTLLKESLVELQTDGGPNACGACKHPETEVSCDGKGCNRSYHLSCLDPPLQNTPPGIWLCIFCIKRKIEFGLYSVSEGIDSVWNFKEGVQTGKHYLIKYKGLAHVHNQWIQEAQMLQEAPTLLTKFNRKCHRERAIRWKQEWTEPHRLLQKRLLMPRKLADEFFDGLGNSFPKCYHEWFVKWKGLGYEDATWEFESSSFLHTPEAMTLMKEYEARLEAKAAFDSSNADEALKFRTNHFVKLTRLPDGCPPGLDNDHLNCINRLREFWHRNQNTVFIDDQERVTKSILFIVSLLSYACRPFLIISPCTSLSLWETEFNRLAPSINLVVYNGSKDVRKMIQTLEFYEGGGRIMFQVLLSHPDAILEDLETLEFIAWEAFLIDECQNARVSKHLEQLKYLSTGFRLLLLSGQLKDSVAEYLNLLSFLDSGIDENSASTTKSDSVDAVGTLALLKERLSRYVAYDRKQDSSKFLEYWVPVPFSHVQLEQYCATLISNCIPLRSCAKIDLVGALGDILISTRKCCDHPYLVDEYLQSSLTRGLPVTEYLDIGVNASGKLLLLDKFLQTIQNQGLRVLILFQSIGRAGRISIGDILDDFVRQRFGADSYERVDRGLAMSKRLAALNMFNDKARGRFVFLIENRACLPSIKLSSVDAIIIYDSDWNPMNDLRALQKITIESQHDHLVVFRLYSSFTIEEKLLIFAKQDMVLENNIENISPSVCHSMLSWGASNLFRQLDEFHQLDYTDNCSQSSSDIMLLINDVLEILMKLSAYVPSKCSILVKAQQSGASYSRNIILSGEKEGASSLDKDPQSFWSNLLEGRYPQWRYISEPSHGQRSRRKVHNLDESLILSEPENDEVKKKRKKVVSSSTVDAISSESWLQGRREAEGDNSLLSGDPGRPSLSSITKAAFIPNSLQMETEAQPTSQGNAVSHMSPMSDSTLEVNKPRDIDSEGREKLRIAQRSLHLLLKPELSRLCEILKLPENVKDMAQVFLEYIMNNHHVSPEPEMILQAFKISLCWRAASFLKHKIDHQESLALAKKYLNFTCNEDQASNVYSKLRMLKKKFLQRNSVSRRENEPNSLESGPSVLGKDPAGEPVYETSSNSAASNLHEFDKGGLQESPQSHPVLEQLMLPEQEPVPVLGTSSDLHEHLGSLKDELLKKRINLINKICSRREEDIFLKQQQEISDFNMHKEELELNLKKSHAKGLELIHDLVMDSADKNDKIRLFKEEFVKKMAGFGKHMDCQYKKLEDMQSVARVKELQIKNHWLEEAKAGKLTESFDSIPLSASGFKLEEFKVVDQDDAHDGLGSRIIDAGASRPFQNKQIGESITVGDLVTSGLSSKTRSTVVSPGGAGCLPSQIDTSVSRSNGMYETEVFGPLEVPSTIPPLETVDVPMGTEALASTSPIMNLVGNEADDMPINSREQANVETENQRGAENSDISCLRPCPLESIEPDRCTDNGDGASLITFLPQNQEPCLNGHGEPEDSAGLQVQGSGPPQEIPASNSAHFGNLQVELTNNNTTVPDSFHHPLPVCTAVPLVARSQGSIAASGIDKDPSDQIQHSNQQNDMPMQEPVVSPSVLVGQSNPHPVVSQFVDHSVLPNSDMRSQRSISEDLTSTSTQPESVHYPLFPLVQLMPTQGLQPEPLKNELTRIQIHGDRITKMHDDRKLRLKFECDQELEKVRRKYDMLLQDAESEFLQNKKMLETIYNKVFMNQVLAEEFRAKFIENKGGASSSSQGQRTLQQLLQASQPQFVQRSVSSSSSMPIPLPATLPPAAAPAPASLASVRLRAPSISSVQTSRQASSIYPNNSARPLFSPMLPPRPNLQAGSETRSPAPHLQRFRANTSMLSQNLLGQTSGTTSQQYPPANVGSATMGQVAPIPNTQPCMVPMSGTSQPVVSSTVSVCQDASPSNVELPMDVGDSRGGANQPNMSQLADLVPALDNWFSTNLTPTTHGLSHSCVDVVRTPTDSDVVCISDDD